ncbi:hypothetical protein A7J57_04745 [Agrobacterium tumefaciens]|uniref:Uncharacterized protein n=1 Tax=Agrobacterium tumefaciens TaxID=358 RepID=A0A176X747_AGRTU|nr:hypothetical protein A7J57_04745 [Agrobacterium tumefaciens]
MPKFKKRREIINVPRRPAELNKGAIPQAKLFTWQLEITALRLAERKFNLTSGYGTPKLIHNLGYLIDRVFILPCRRKCFPGGIFLPVGKNGAA